MAYMRHAATVFLLLLSVPDVTATERPANIKHGKVLYERYCVSCHGEHGDGKGESAEWMTPKPRDYRQGIFKWRSTPSGSLPLPADLERTIENGVYGTYMPSWYALGHGARRDLIGYIETFSARWKSEKPGEPIIVPPEPAETPEALSHGQILYKENGCATCHGEDGQGNGPSAPTLKDQWGNPSVPTDLTQGHMKCSQTPRGIYRILMTGIDGTPMPSFADALKGDDAWDLARYIESLSHRQPRHE